VSDNSLADLGTQYLAHALQNNRVISNDSSYHFDLVFFRNLDTYDIESVL
jgi:hypothetical protein